VPDVVITSLTSIDLSESYLRCTCGVRRDPWGVCGGTPAAREDLVWVRKGIIGAAVGILDTHWSLSCLLENPLKIIPKSDHVSYTPTVRF